MKKLFSLALCVVLVIIFSITCCAQSANISIDAEKSGRTGADVSVYVQSDSFISGGVFVVTFDKNEVSFKDVSSDLFEVDSKLSDSKLEVVIASGSFVDISDKTEAFSVKFSNITKSDFDISVEVKSLVDKNLRCFMPEKSKVNYAVDIDSESTVKTKAVSDNNSKSSESSKKTDTKKSVTQSSDKKELSSKEFYPESESSKLTVGVSKTKRILLIVMVCVMVIAAFAFGIVFRKNFFEKKDKSIK